MMVASKMLQLHSSLCTTSDTRRSRIVKHPSNPALHAVVLSFITFMVIFFMFIDFNTDGMVTHPLHACHVYQHIECMRFQWLCRNEWLLVLEEVALVLLSMYILTETDCFF